MESRLEKLLAQNEPLERHEINDLKEWLEVLRQDCRTFGATAEDRTRMARIEATIDASTS